MAGQEQIISANELIRYLKIVQESGRLEILVLRAHLLAEEKLRALIVGSLVHAEHFDQRSFNYQQCLMLAQSMHWKPDQGWVWECLKLLNGIRNSMAHILFEKHKESILPKIERLDLLIGKHSGVPMPSNLGPSVTRLHWRLASLYAAIGILGDA
jgi:hypothetical protein